VTGFSTSTMEMVAVLAGKVIDFRPGQVHTVTATLNGQHGGVDVIIDGTNPDGSEWQTRAVLR